MKFGVKKVTPFVIAKSKAKKQSRVAPKFIKQYLFDYQ